MLVYRMRIPRLLILPPVDVLVVGLGRLVIGPSLVVVVAGLMEVAVRLIVGVEVPVVMVVISLDLRFSLVVCLVLRL